MSVRAVGNNEQSHLNTVVKSTAVGLAAGYAMKCWWPVTSEENKYNRRIFINSCHKLVNDAKIDEFSKNPELTPAQNAFKEIVLSKDKKAFTLDSIKAKAASLGGEESAAGKEFRAIVKNVNETSKTLRRNAVTAYKIMLKKARPMAPFLVAGAGAGFIAGFAKNMVRGDV